MSASSTQPLREPYLGVPEVCDQLGVRPHFVYRLAASRQLGHVRFGKLLRFTQADIDDYVARQRVEAQPLGSR
jgi:excisionase family DNA binding protein